MSEDLNRQLAKWKKVLLVYLGAGIALTLAALVDLPGQMQVMRSVHAMTVDGWCGLAAILWLASLTPGIALLVAPHWRQAQLEDRVSVAFGFLGVAWLALLGFSLRVNVLLPWAFHLIVAALGVGLAGWYLLLRRGRPRKEEMFP